MRHLAPLLLVAACAQDLASDPAPPPQGALQLTAYGPVLAGEDVLFLVSGATPGDRVYVGVGAFGTGSCPPALAGGCLDIVAPTLLGSARADASGTAQLTVTVPSGLPLGAVGAQAASVGPTIGISDTVTLRPLPDTWNGAVDCAYVCEGRDEPSGWCWLDDQGFGVSGPGGVDDCIDWCMIEGPSLDVTQTNAFATCASGNPLCFQSVEDCVEAEAASRVWLSPRIDGWTDAGGDGRWNAGERLTVDVTLDNLGVDFFAYPGVRLEADHPGVLIPQPEVTWFGMLSGDSYTGVFEVEAAAVPAGTSVTLRAVASGLGCAPGTWPMCPDANDVAVTLTVQ